MKITWFGQACFELVLSDGTVIICDPYHPNVGYPAHPRPVDVVTVSHEHFDHNFTGWIEGSPVIVRGVGETEVKTVRLTGLPSFHDEEQGAKRGPNTIFVIEADGLRVCHLGDLGDTPSDDVFAAIGKPDVLMIPVGGFYTIDAEAAARIAGKVGARLTIPMHFATGAGEIPIAPVDAFEALMGAKRQAGSSVDVAKDYAGPAVLVLDYLRD